MPINPYDDVIAAPGELAASSPVANPYDDVIVDEQARQQTQLRANVTLAAGSNPQQIAAQRQLAKYVGFAPAVGEALPDEVKRLAAVKRVADDTAGMPVLQKAYSEADFARIAREDSANLANINRTFAGSAGDAGVALAKGVVAFPQSLVGIADLVTGGYAGKAAQTLGVDFKRTRDILDQLYSPAQQAANKQVAESEDFLDTFATMVQNPSTIATTVIESLPLMLGGAAVGRQVMGAGAKLLGAGMAGPNLPSIMVRQFGERTAAVLAAAFGEGTIAAGGAAEQLRGNNTDGLLSVKDELAAIGTGVGTMLFGAVGGRVAQRLGINDIDTVLVSRGLSTLSAGLLKTGFVSAVVKGGITEGLFEELPQSVQEQMWQNWANDKPLGEGVGKAAAQGVLAGFAMGGGFNAIGKVTQHFGDIADAQSRSAQLQAAIAAALPSTVREHSPDEFRQVVQAMAEGTEGAPREIYVDAEVLNQLAPEVLNQLPQAVRDQIPDALAANDAVSIPIGDVLTIAPSTPLEQVLIEHGRLNGVDSMSQAEAKHASSKAQEFLATESARVIAQAVDQQATQESHDRVKQTVLDQLNSTGRFRAQVNEGTASMFAAMYTTLAGELGITPEQAFADHAVDIVGQTGQGSVLNASERSGTNDAVPDTNAPGPQGGERTGATQGNAVTKKLTQAQLEVGRSFFNTVEALAEKHGTLFVRWSPTSKRDLAGKHTSRDFVAGKNHVGLSAVEITGNTHPVDIAKAIAKYGFLRLQDSESVPRIYVGNRIGTDSDGHALIKPKSVALEVPPEIVAALDSRLDIALDLIDGIETDRQRLSVITDNTGREIVKAALDKKEKDLKELLLNESTASGGSDVGAGIVSRQVLSPDVVGQTSTRRSTQEVSRLFKAMATQFDIELQDALFNWNGSELNADKDQIVRFPGRDGASSKGKEGGKLTVSKAEFFDWLMSSKPLDRSIYGDSVNDPGWLNSIQKLRGVVNPAALSNVLNQDDAKVNNLTSVAERGQRIVGTRASFSAAEKQAVKASAEKTGVSEKEITAAVRGHKLAHPMSQGWAPLTFVNAKIEVDDKGKSKVVYNYQNTAYSFSSNSDGKQIDTDSPAYKKRVNAVAKAMVDEVRRVFHRSGTGDQNAKNILAQAGWYKAMRARLRQEFGGLGDLFADLLGATSPNTPVRDNWTNAVDTLRRASRGDYDTLLPQWVRWADTVDALELDLRGWFNERIAEGEPFVAQYEAARAARDEFLASAKTRGQTQDQAKASDEFAALKAAVDAADKEASKFSKAAIKTLPEYKSKTDALKAARVLDDSLLPTKESGKKYGFNGKNVARAMVDLWRVVKNADPDIGRGDTAPKALNFSGNLIGFRTRATIDVWAARMLQRLSGGLRIPSMAETGVSGAMREDSTTTLQFGMGQDIFAEAVQRILVDPELKTDKVLAGVNDDDLQAVVWFIEKELWTVNNWTSAAGEGGSFEVEASLTGNADQARIKELRRVIDSSKSKPEAKVAARAELASLERTVDRFVGGLSTQMSLGTQGVDFVPTDADMARLAEQIRLAAYEDDRGTQVLASKMLSTEGRYGGVERSLDMEVVAREGYNPTKLWAEMLRQAQAAKQDSTFLSRVLRDKEAVDLLRHRPGVEIYFREAADAQGLEAVLADLAKEGVEFLTVVVDGRRMPGAVAGEMPPAVGVRLQYVPEFDQRYGFDNLTGLSDEELSAKIKAKAKELSALAERVLATVKGVAFAGQFWHDTQVAFSHQYQEKLNAAIATGTAEGTAGGVGGPQWSGESIRAGLENADRQSRETSSGQPDSGSGSAVAGDAGSTLAQGELKQSAYHGTPHRGIIKFSTDAIGTGEGQQAYGWGLYFASKREIGEYYRNALAGSDPTTTHYLRLWQGDKTKALAAFDKDVQSGAFGSAFSEDRANLIRESIRGESGQLYKVDIPEDSEMLLWDKPLSEQSAKVQAALNNASPATTLEAVLAGKTIPELLSWVQSFDRNSSFREMVDEDPSLTADDVRAAIESSYDSEEMAAYLGSSGFDGGRTGESIYRELTSKIAGAPAANAMTREQLNDWYDKNVGYRPDDDNGAPLPIQQLRDLVAGFNEEIVMAGDAPRSASLYLAALGIKGIKYLDGVSRSAGDGSYNYVVFSGDDVAITSQFYQGQQARGTFNPRNLELALNEGADLSTVHHEMMHLYLELLTRIAQRPDAPASIVANMERFLAWRGIPDLATWQSMTLEQQRPHHEALAEGYESYLLSGKAPSVELQPLMRKIRVYMTSVYKSLKDFVAQNPNSDIKLPAEMVQFYDRMLASEAQIAEAEQVAGLLPDDEGTSEAIERLTARSLRDLKWTVNARNREIKRLQAEAKGLRKSVEAEVTEQVNAMPVYGAKKAMEAAVNESDEDPFDADPGLRAATIADSFGFASVDAMAKAIEAAQPIADVIQGITDQRMLEEHGDLIDQRAIEAAANEAVHNAARAKSLATELKSQAELLNPRTDTGQVNAAGSRISVNAIVEAAKQFAANVVAKTPLKDLKAKAWQHTAAERRAGKAWSEATAAGKTQEAVKAKQDQVLNNAAAKAALEAQVEMRKILEFFKRVYKDGNEKMVEKGRDPDVVNAARAILGAYGAAPQASKNALEYLALVEKNDPAMYAALQPSVQGALNMAQPLQALTMDELRALHEEIQSMWHLAKRSRQMEVDGNMMDIDDAAAELQARMQIIGVPLSMPGDSGAMTAKEDFARKIQFAGSILRRVEQWSEGMDGKVGGAFNRLVFRVVKQAAENYRTDRVTYRKAYQSLVDQVAPSLLKGEIAAPELGYTFGKGHNGIGHAELLHALLHTGNESNKRKLLLGRNWATENADGTMDTRRWDAFIKRAQDSGILSKAHYDFAQGVWGLLEKTKPLAQKTHRDVFGRYFAEVTADAFSTPFGDYAGGYVPAQADPRLVQEADQRAMATTENENMSFAFPSTNKGFTKARVEYNRPLMLDLRTIGQHIDKVLLFSHMESAVRDVQKLMTRKGVSQSLGRIDPTIYAGMLTPWLNRSARQIVETPIVGDGGVARMLSAARSRAGMSLMFANVSNTLQQLTGFAGAFAKLKSDGLESSMMRATAKFISDPKSMAKAVSDASPYMADRMANEMAAINDSMDKILLDPSLYERAQAWTREHAYFLQTALDNTMGPIIWTAAFNADLAKRGDEKAAAQYADSVIRQTQGSTLPEDVSRIETGPAYARVFTQFIGYFNMMANTNGTALKQIAAETGLKKGAGKALMVVTMGMLVPVWVAEAIAQAMRGGPDDEDDDGYLDDWLMAVFGMGTIKGAFAMVPFIGQLANAGFNRFNGNPADDKMSLSPAVSLLEAAVGVPVDVYKAITGEVNKRNMVRDVASLVGLATGLPTVAVARPLGYLAGVADDRIEPSGPVDAVRGMVTGTASPESKQR